MQQLSFQINQAVLVENNTPYQYDLAKILDRIRNQDQAIEYQIKFYKETCKQERKLIEGFKIKKISLKLFQLLKQKCQQFPELAKSFKSVQNELSKNEVFIEKEKQDRNWKKLFRKCVLYLEAKRSQRIKYQSRTRFSYSSLEKESEVKGFQAAKNGINVLVKVLFERKKGKSMKKKSQETIAKQIKQSSKQKQQMKNSSKKQKQKEDFKSKKNNEISQNIIDKNCQSLYFFGLKYIQYTKKLSSIEQYFKQPKSEIVMMPLQEVKCLQELEKQLQEFKSVLFQAQFKKQVQKPNIEQMQQSLKLKLNMLLHFQLQDFPQKLIEKIRLVIKIYCLEQHELFQMIIGTLKLWLRLFLEKMKKELKKNKLFLQKVQKLEAVYQEVCSLAVLQ